MDTIWTRTKATTSRWMIERQICIKRTHILDLAGVCWLVSSLADRPCDLKNSLSRVILTTRPAHLAATSHCPKVHASGGPNPAGSGSFRRELWELIQDRMDALGLEKAVTTF